MPLCVSTDPASPSLLVFPAIFRCFIDKSGAKKGRKVGHLLESCLLHLFCWNLRTLTKLFVPRFPIEFLQDISKAANNYIRTRADSKHDIMTKDDDRVDTRGSSMSHMTLWLYLTFPRAIKDFFTTRTSRESCREWTFAIEAECTTCNAIHPTRILTIA